MATISFKSSWPESGRLQARTSQICKVYQVLQVAWFSIRLGEHTPGWTCQHLRFGLRRPELRPLLRWCQWHSVGWWQAPSWDPSQVDNWGGPLSTVSFWHRGRGPTFGRAPSFGLAWWCHPTFGVGGFWRVTPPLHFRVSVKPFVMDAIGIWQKHSRKANCITKGADWPMQLLCSVSVIFNSIREHLFLCLELVESK